MQTGLWFFTEDDKSINLGNKPSYLASFIVRTRTESDIELKEPVTQDDLKQMGFNNADDLMNDLDYNSKVRIYVRNKFSADNTCKG